ncbi:MAG: UBA/TS-N domain protein [Coriobacteriia bacterium]|nr:UBA/TS-N domain protein [Coriobacteriia bacterium]
MSDPTATDATGPAATPSDEEKMRKAELVRDKTGVSFEEARAALELSGYDVLDAVVLLERQGKTAAKTASYATSGATSADEQDAARMAQAQSDYEQSTKANAFVDGFSRFMGWLKRVLRKSVDTSLVAERQGRQMFSMPILIVILLVVFAFWVTIPLLIISLFFEFRYHFDGVGTIEVNLNDLSDKASDGVDNLKRTVMGDEASNQNGTQQ